VDVAIWWNRRERTFDVTTRDWVCDEPGGPLYEADVIWTQQRTYGAARRYRWEFLQKRQEREARERGKELGHYPYTPTPEDEARFADELADVFGD
jgi:hypothetical protein